MFFVCWKGVAVGIVARSGFIWFFLFVFGLSGDVLALDSYRTVTASDGSTAVLPLSDQRGDGKSMIAVVPYGGSAGGAVTNTGYRNTITFDLEICPLATKPSSECAPKIYGFSGQQAGSSGWVSGALELHGFVGVRVTSMSVQGTGPTAALIYINKTGTGKLN